MKKKERIKINILTTGRFHALDLARELDKKGFDVKFYTYVKPKRCAEFGLPNRCCKCLFYPLSPFIALEFVVFKKGKLHAWAYNLRRWIQDLLTGLIMRKADIVIAMSGEFVYSLKQGHKKGAKVILERGAMHVLEQQKVLSSNPSGKSPYTKLSIRRELKGYTISDFVSIPGTHVKKSFLKYKYPEQKLFVNPYGVDLRQFYYKKTTKKYDVIMTGNFSYEKGCDILVKAIDITGLSLLHVGALNGVDFPNRDGFTHIDAVDQSKLIDYYNQAKVFCLPSRQDGFGLVLLQAIACQLPVVGTQNNGAPDLKRIFNNTNSIIISEGTTPELLANALREAIKIYDLKCNDSFYTNDQIKSLSWDGYGNRYASFIRNVIKNR